jgi:hypothetical protein
VVEESYHFDVEQDPDTFTHQTEKLNPDPDKRYSEKMDPDAQR